MRGSPLNCTEPDVDIQYTFNETERCSSSRLLCPLTFQSNQGSVDSPSPCIVFMYLVAAGRESPPRLLGCAKARVLVLSAETKQSIHLGNNSGAGHGHAIR